MKINKNKFLNVFVFFKKFLLLAIISLAIGFGCKSFIFAPILADDLIIFIQGIAQFGDPGSSWAMLLKDKILASTGFHHIMPMAAVLDFGQNLIIFWLNKFINDLPLLWFLFRFGWHIFSLLALALFLNTVLFSQDNKEKKFKSFVAIYGMLGITFISFTQIHNVWKEAPVISYGVVGAGIAAMGFLYLSGVYKIAYQSFVTFRLMSFTTILGTFGILTYEMFVAPLVVGFFMTILKVIPLKEISLRRAWPKLVPTIFPLLIFLSTQTLRLLNPEENYYDGTKLGSSSHIFPNFVTSLYGSLPMAYIDLAAKFVGVLKLDFNSLSFVLGSVTSILIIIFLVNIGNWSHIRFAVSQRFTFLSTVLVSTWVISTGIFMFTAKYQNELAIDIGRVYMFYVFGNLGVIGVTTLWFLFSRNWMKVLILLTVLLIGFHTSTYNKALVAKIETDSAIQLTSQMLNTLNLTVINSSKNCNMLIEIRNSSLPDYYKNIFIPSYMQIYYQTKGQVFCPI